MTAPEIKTKVLIAGINRFYGEGYVKWSKSSFVKLIDGEVNEDIKQLLNEFERLGFIEFTEDDDCYIEVLTQI